MASRLTFHLILHTHWDREWYLPRAGFQARLVPAVGEVLDLIEREPDTRFVLDGQTVLAEDALDIRPEWIPRAVRAVTERQLEVGPWYVLADELVPSGESMIRNLLQGARDAESLGGRMNVLYSPDAFGHPGVLPTIAAEFGIAEGVTWRGLQGSPTIDRDLYRWRGTDGRELLTYHLPAAGYEIGGDLGRPGQLAGTWARIRGEIVDRAVTSHIAVFVGADHHGPPANAIAIQEGVQSLESGNFVRLSSLREFFDAARPEADAAPLIAGEQRWSYGHTWTLQETHATRARLKRRHGAVELYLQRLVDPMVAMAWFHLGHEQSALIRTAWRMLLQSQFHDTICGCCNDLVAREQEVRLGSVYSIGDELARDALQVLCGHSPDFTREHPSDAVPTLLFWNAVPRSRTGIVIAEISCFRRDIMVGPPSARVPRIGPGFQPFALVSIDGQSTPVQVLSVTRATERVDAAHHYPDQDEVDIVRVAFHGPPVDGLGFTGFTLGAPAPLPASSVHASTTRLENPFITIMVDDDGRLDMIDRRSGERYVDMLSFLDEHDDGDTYTPWISSERDEETTSHGHADVIANGPFVGAIERRLNVQPVRGGALSVRMVLMLFADSPALRVRLQIENSASDHRLRLRIPVGAGDTATAGAAFGFEERGPVDVAAEHYPAEHPPKTAPGHRYVAAGSGDRGLALLCPGFFEYEWTTRRELIFTVIRSIGELSRDDLPTRPGHAGWPMPTPDAQEPGMHVVEFAIGPLGENESTDIAALETMWEDTHLPAQATFIRSFTGDLALLAGLGAQLEGAGLIFSALKRSESGTGVVLRCYNIGTGPSAGRWTFRSALGSAVLVRSDESEVGPLVVVNERTLEFVAPARGIVSILVMPR